MTIKLLLMLVAAAGLLYLMSGNPFSWAGFFVSIGVLLTAGLFMLLNRS